MFLASARMTLDFAFQNTAVNRLEARAVVQNGRGNGALRKLGAVQEGVLRGSLLKDGTFLDWEGRLRPFARVFDTTALLVGRLGDEGRRLLSREPDAIATLSPTECRDASPILRAKQHDERRVVPDDGRVEGAACLESRATREEYGVAAVQTGPGRERRLVRCGGPDCRCGDREHG